MLLECVPNFSEGRDTRTIDSIVDAIRQVPGIRWLGVDAGHATNRAVTTFAGPPEAVVEAAFLSIRRARDSIDLTRHIGAHPRMGATDVCPLVPLRGMTWEHAIAHARKLARRVGEELGIPVYLYGKAASSPERQDLARIRSGEFEGLAKKLKDPDWRPDFGPAEGPLPFGATAIGVRGLMIAYNVGLEGNSLKAAKTIAARIRASGGAGSKGNPNRRFPDLKAIGWYLDDFRCAQVSMNITNIGAVPLLELYDTIAALAGELGTRVIGSELVGLMPKRPLLEAGATLLGKAENEERLIEAAAEYLGLWQLKPFLPATHILENALGLAEPLPV